MHHFALLRFDYLALELRREVILEVVEFRLFVFIYYLFVAEGSLCLRIPVHHAQSAVDISLVVEIDKNLDDTLRTLLVHGECRAVPVARCTKTAQLLEDDAAMLVSPVPSVLEELVAREVVFLYSLFGKTFHHLSLGGYGSMVGARHPACVFPLHACSAHEDVLNSVVKHVSHVQHTCDIWRRNDDSVWFASVGLAAEELVVKPILIPFRLHRLWVIFALNFHLYIAYLIIRFKKRGKITKFPRKIIIFARKF